jgi:hypothetical protein
MGINFTEELTPGNGKRIMDMEARDTFRKHRGKHIYMRIGVGNLKPPYNRYCHYVNLVSGHVNYTMDPEEIVIPVNVTAQSEDA